MNVGETKTAAEIPDKLNFLTAQLSDIEQMVMDISERIKPVRNIQPTAEPVEQADRTVCKTALGQEIEEATAKTREISIILANINNSLEI